MAITPESLREVEFRASLRGYHPDDVDEFLERMAAGIELLHERIRETTEQAVRREQANIVVTAPDDESMRALLTASQEQADAALLAARTAADQLVRSAEAYATALADEVKGTLDRTRADARTQIERDLRRLDASRQRLMTEVTAAQRLILEQGVVPPAPPVWPPCLIAVEHCFDGEPPLV
jgi:cell division initiation protein